MKKTLIGMGIITSIILTGCTTTYDQMDQAPKTVVDMMKNTQIAGWENYTDDKDKDKVPDYKDKCPNTPLGAIVDKYGCAIDTDKDGVINFYDKCPNTPLGIKVNNIGCPIDNDKDGVPNYKDKCPNTPAGIQVDVHGCAIDADKDGVADFRDKCLNTPLGAKVDAYGCAFDDDKDGVANGIDKCPDTPKGAKVDKHGCALDTDKDGVINLFDKCPNTPKGVSVGVDGCPIDSDKDGVPNYKDRCPNTPKGMKVNFQGCPILAEFRFHFAFDSYKIDKQYYPQIKKLAQTLKNNKNIKIDIQGYTDNIGGYLYNKELSLKRANALRKILINKFKISPNRITIMGYGSDYPVAVNTTKAGRALNRRIVVIDKSHMLVEIPVESPKMDK